MANTTPRYRQSKFWLDLGERVVWTAAEVVLGLVAVDSLDLPTAYVPIAAAVLAAVKGFVARHLVSPNEDSASTVPGV